eukprot:Gb_17773 [translate_table: standard]
MEATLRKRAGKEKDRSRSSKLRSDEIDRDCDHDQTGRGYSVHLSSPNYRSRDLDSRCFIERKEEVTEVQASMEYEFYRNKEIFSFLKWGSNALHDMLVDPPCFGIVYLVNLEYLEGLFEAEIMETDNQIQGVEKMISGMADGRAGIEEVDAIPTLAEEKRSKENKVTLVEKEKEVSEEFQVLTARGPELEAEKTVAAVARNFQETRRIASEAKALSLEKDIASSNMERDFTELQALEEEIKFRVTSLNEVETLISSNKREASMTRCERLRLVAAATREECSASLGLEDLEGAKNLLAEVETADSEADKLKEADRTIDMDSSSKESSETDKDRHAKFVVFLNMIDFVLGKDNLFIGSLMNSSHISSIEEHSRNQIAYGVSSFRIWLAREEGRG